MISGKQMVIIMGKKGDARRVNSGDWNTIWERL